ncbi:cytochrome c oxidase assembly protein COX20, mitochondrial [Bufo gargarizans]|uniref:cytochrome c oxidase assembly protein COX20, mitochondrial n=1 Tax=Bufo gargarizans TaxID=30331 RepID=UPI001CF58356|nr:cytochrome c oxidase assembly protein COX20, mitochondrial [Bufo gargarizans]
MADEEGGLEKEKSFKLLWILDVQKVPCARESVLFGSVGSLVIGVGHFLATSRVKRSCDLAAGGFILSTLGSWLYCRYNYAKLRIQQKIVQDGIKKKVIYEGSNIDPTVNNSSKSGS